MDAIRVFSKERKLHAHVFRIMQLFCCLLLVSTWMQMHTFDSCTPVIIINNIRLGICQKLKCLLVCAQAWTVFTHVVLLMECGIRRLLIPSVFITDLYRWRTGRYGEGYLKCELPWPRNQHYPFGMQYARRNFPPRLRNFAETRRAASENGLVVYILLRPGA